MRVCDPFDFGTTLTVDWNVRKDTVLFCVRLSVGSRFRCTVTTVGRGQVQVQVQAGAVCRCH